MKTMDSWKIVLWNCILDFDEEQVYLVPHLLILKIKGATMWFMFGIVGITLPPSNASYLP